MIVGLRQYQNVWEMFLKPLKALSCGVGGNRIELVLWHALNLPFFKILEMLLFYVEPIMYNRIHLKIFLMVIRNIQIV